MVLPDYPNEVTFVVENAYRRRGNSRYISIDNPKRDMEHLRNSADVVMPNKVVLILSVPFEQDRRFEMSSAHGQGFTRLGIARAICRLMRICYIREVQAHDLCIDHSIDPEELRLAGLTRVDGTNQYHVDIEIAD
jgi:hypothetical protein